MSPTSQIVLVSGGSRGIGAAVVRQAAHSGAKVCFSYLDNEPAAQSLVAEMHASGYTAHAFRGDVADPAFARGFIDCCRQNVGAPTALVNNAGITGRVGPFSDLPLEVLRRTMDVNVIGTMLLTQQVIRHWRESRTAGRIVNISSIASALGSPGEYVHYAASKSAIDAFTIGLGKELASEGIRVNAVAAGTTLTDIHAAGGVPDRPAQMAERIPMQRAARPEEIAAAVIWLLSDQASYVTASILRVSGGL